MPFCDHLCLIDEIISRISQNDLHILHNGHICQTYKIIRVNIELAILPFILPILGHVNFECQQVPLAQKKKLSCHGSPQLSSMVMDQISRPPWSGYGLCGWVLDAGTDLLEGRSASEKARDTFVQKQQLQGGTMFLRSKL